MEEINLNNPDYYINSELSFLEFNRRVLAQASDKHTPMLVRLFFICIASSNMDEFFAIRVAGLKQQIALRSMEGGADKMTPSEQLKRIHKTSHEFMKSQYQIFEEEVLPALKNNGINLSIKNNWNKKQSQWIKRYFNRELLPALSPIGLDPAHPFPKVLDKSLNFIISLEGKDAFGRNSGIAILQAPRALPIFVKFPSSCANHEYDFVLLTSIIHKHVDELFPGMEVTGCYQFRVTRNADLLVQEEEVEDLLRALKGELPSRRFAQAVRLEVGDNCPQDMTDYLIDKFKLQTSDVYQVSGPVNLARMITIPELVDRPDLKFPTFIPGLPKRLIKSKNIFDTIKKGDILLHHPFQSFSPIIDFLKQAASDPTVIAIKQTLYRTGIDSNIVGVLISAAQAGKEVTVVIELRARFDEEDNIALANKLQASGVHVSYGVVGHKAHTKMILIIRREGKKLKRYVHLSTGNYHAGSATQYTDHGFFTSDTSITEDIQKVFQQLTAMGKPGKLKKVLQAPFTLHKAILEHIQHETNNANDGKPARIIAKMNALTEQGVIEALYKASQAGVKIDLIVRGICCLRPGLKGVSDNIQVRSIIGRFLEHSRVFYFHNNGEYKIYCSSADWRDRNFFRRVETCFPIEDKRLKKKILKRGLLNYLSDNSQSWILQKDGTYAQSSPGNAIPKSAQNKLLNTYSS